MNHKPTDSPALKHQSEIYPANYRGRVPLKIRMAKTVYPDLPFLCKRHDTVATVATVDEVYECWVNQNGAVAAICRNGESIGVKPGEFDVIEWHGGICPRVLEDTFEAGMMEKCGDAVLKLCGDRLDRNCGLPDSKEIYALIRKCLAPVPELADAFPCVLYFPTRAAATEFLELVKAAKPNMEERKL